MPSNTAINVAKKNTVLFPASERMLERVLN